MFAGMATLFPSRPGNCFDPLRQMWVELFRRGALGRLTHYGHSPSRVFSAWRGTLPRAALTPCSVHEHLVSHAARPPGQSLLYAFPVVREI